MHHRRSVAVMAGVAVALLAGVAPATGAASPTGSALTSPAADEAPDPTSTPPDPSPLPSVPAAEPMAAQPAPTELLVTFAPDVPVVQERAVLRSQGAAAADTIPGTDVVVVPVGEQDPDALAAQLDADPLVLHVEPNHVRTVTAWTDDPYLDYTWPAFDILRLPRAWDVGNGVGTVIAVLDTGVFAEHEDLAGAVLPGWDFVNGDPNPADDHGHGTAVAGIAAARGDNGLGFVGAAWGASVLPVKVLDGAGHGNDATVAEGIRWAAEQGADIINLSLGGPGSSTTLRDAMAYAVGLGSVVVVAAGNDGSAVAQYPAAYAPEIEGVVAVGATDSWGSLTEFSSWGDWVTLAAPGFDIGFPGADGDYYMGDGTSFAAPYVSGAAALLVAQGASGPAAVEASLTSTARDAGPRGVDPYYGHGVLDVAAALGLGTSVPLDRMSGDATPEDGLPALAVDLAGTAVATLAPEGDVDWYRFTSASAGWFEVTVSVMDQVGTGEAAIDPVVEVLDSDGRVLASVDEKPTNAAESAVFQVAAGDSALVGVSNVNGSSSLARYNVGVTAANAETPEPFRVTARTDVQMMGATAVADVTGDPNPDLMLVAASSPSFMIKPGLGDGTFGATSLVALGATTGTSTGLTTLDADADGDADAVVGTTDGFVLVRRAGDDLTADPVTPLGGGARALKAADLDGDGDVDLVATGFSPAVLTVFLNDGTGGFVRGADVTAAPTSFAVGDVSADGLPDLVTAGGQVHLQQPGTTFVAGTPLPLAGHDVALGDVTGDGVTDAVQTVTGNPGQVLVTPGTGPATFAAAVAYDGWQMPEPVEIFDVDDDGRLDVVIANGGWNAVSVLRQSAAGTLGAPERSAISYASHYSVDGFVATDLNGDTREDLVVGAFNIAQVLVASAPGEPAWVHAAGLAPHQAGVGVRPTVTVTAGRELAPGSAGPATVRLLDGGTAAAIPATVAYDAASRTVSLTPTTDLTPGHHYEVLVSGLTDTAGAAQPQPYRTWFTVAAGGQRFTPVEPYRVLDTRNGTGATGVVRPGSPIQLTLGGKEVPSDATAVVLNVTAVGPSAVGNVRVYPTPAGVDKPPTISNLNVVPGVDQPNLVTVTLGRDGKVSLATDGTTAHLIADVAGYFSEGGATAFVPVDPVRVMDTRNGTGGVPAARVRAGKWVDLVVTDRNGVPSDANAVVLNVTGVAPDGRTNVRVYPTPAASEYQAPPSVSNLNLVAGRDQPNLVTVAVGDGGRVRFYTQSASVSLVADLAGYYSPTGDHGYVPLTPTRIADTRSGLGFPKAPIVAGTTSHLKVAGANGVPSTAAAAVLNLTAVSPQQRSNVRVFPTTVPTVVPLVSNLNVVAGRDEPNLAIVRLGDQGRVSVYSQSANLGMVVDIAGYFTR